MITVASVAGEGPHPAVWRSNASVNQEKEEQEQEKEKQEGEELEEDR